MPWLITLLVVVQVICAVAIIILVLLQHGKGADMGAAFGSGASGSLFGASGSANFLSRSTAVVAGLFFLATIGLAYSANSLRAARGGGLMSTVVPAAPVPPGSGAAPPAAVPESAKPASASAPTPADKSAAIPK